MGQGIGDEGLGALNNKKGILGALADDANLPDELDDKDFKDNFNEEDNCELCEVKFSKVSRISRHHCRKCYKSVCQKCSSNNRKLAKNDNK